MEDAAPLVFKVGFTKQDIKKNFLHNLTRAFPLAINFVQSTEFDIVLYAGDEETKIYGLVPILHHIFLRVVGHKDALHPEFKDTLWLLLETYRTAAEAILEEKEIDLEIL